MTRINNIENACFIEDIVDFKIIYKNYNSKKSLYVPLDMETLLFCKKYNVKIFDFNEYIKDEFHIKANQEAKKFTENLKFKKNINYSFKSEIIGYLRFRLHSIILIIEIIEILINKLKIKKLVVSGIKKDTHFLHEPKIISEIVKNIFPNLTSAVSDQNIAKEKIYISQYQAKSQADRKNKILISNGGYNFKRVCNFFRKLNYKIYLPSFKKVSFLDQIIYFLRGITVVNFEKKVNYGTQENFVEKINFTYSNKYDLSFLLNLFNTKLNFYFNDLNQKIFSIKKFIKSNNFDLLISNIARGLDGSILDADIKEPTLLIPHGIISSAFNEDDKIYKKNIAEAVFNGESKFFAIQSKIMNNSLETHKIGGKPIVTGNLIFSFLNRRKKNKKKYVLFATTLKGFTNLQYLGVDMFYEYWKILEDLNEISKKKNEKIVIKVHPQFKQCKDEIKKYFKFLYFSNSRIDKLLKNASSLISLSSGTIEDSLNSKVPVILYDRNSRYRQMKILKTEDENNAVNYINGKKELEKTIDRIKNRSKFNFDQYIYEYDFNKILFSKILPLINNEKKY